MRRRYHRRRGLRGQVLDALEDDPVSEAEAQEVRQKEAQMIIKKRSQKRSEGNPQLSDLSAEELRDLCRERGLPVRGTKSEMITRLEAEASRILEDSP